MASLRCEEVSQCPGKWAFLMTECIRESFSFTNRSGLQLIFHGVEAASPAGRVSSYGGALLLLREIDRKSNVLELLDNRNRPVAMHVKGRGQVTHRAILAVQMLSCQGKPIHFEADRSVHKLLLSDGVALKLAPQAKPADDDGRCSTFVLRVCAGFWAD